MKIKLPQETPFGLIPFEREIDPSPRPIFSFPKIPIGVFWQIASWQREIACEHKCESTASLFLVDDKWYAVPFFQENTKSSMTINVDYESEENAELLARFCDKSIMHGSVHNHVMSGAGQSGVDHADEKNLPGPHITLGKMDEVELDWNARFSVIDPETKEHQFIQLKPRDIIDLSPLTQYHEEETDKLLTLVERYILCTPETYAYPEEWGNRFSIKTATWNNWNKKKQQPHGTPGTNDRLWELARDLMRNKLSIKTPKRFRKSIEKCLATRDEPLQVAVAQGIARFETIEKLHTALL